MLSFEYFLKYLRAVADTRARFVRFVSGAIDVTCSFLPFDEGLLILLVSAFQIAVFAVTATLAACAGYVSRAVAAASSSLSSDEGLFPDEFANV